MQLQVLKDYFSESVFALINFFTLRSLSTNKAILLLTFGNQNSTFWCVLEFFMCIILVTLKAVWPTFICLPKSRGDGDFGHFKTSVCIDTLSRNVSSSRRGGGGGGGGFTKGLRLSLR